MCPSPLPRTFAVLALTSVGLARCAAEPPVGDTVYIDTWTQPGTPEVDVLFVIDDSSSMDEEQQRLVDGFDAFADALEAGDADFHLGVVSASLGLGGAPLVGDPPVLDPGVRRWRKAFVDRALLGVSGADQEQGLTAAELALDPVLASADGDPDGFLRDESQVVTLFVSDEDDCSDDGALDGLPATACYEPTSPLVPVVRWWGDVVETLGDAGRLRVGAIVPPAEPSCDGVYPGLRYREAAALSGGFAADACAEDWTEALGALGRMAAGTRTRFQLSHAAEPGSLVVAFDDVEVPAGSWRYDLDSWTVVFDEQDAPPRGITVTCTYVVDETRSVPGL